FWATVSLSVLTSVGLAASRGAFSGSGAFQTLVGAKSAGAADAAARELVGAAPARLVTRAGAVPCVGGATGAPAARPLAGAVVAAACAVRTTARATLVTTKLSATKRPTRRVVLAPAATRAWPLRDESDTRTVTGRRAGVAMGRERR